MLAVDIVIFLTFLLVLAIGLTGFFGLILPMPYVPTPKPIVREMIRLAGLRGSENVFDLGAGDGAILREAKRLHPGIAATGVELSPAIWFLGKLRIALSGSRIGFFRRDAMKTDVRGADVVFLYASPRFLAMVAPKLESELRPGARVISHSFPLPGREPVETVKFPWGRRHRTLYRYDW